MKADSFLTTDNRIASQLLQQIVVGGPVPTFVIDVEHKVVLWNHACEMMTGKPAKDMLGTCNQWQAFYPEPKPVLADLVVDGCTLSELNRLYDYPCRLSEVVSEAFEVEDNFPFSELGRWMLITAAPLRDNEGQVIGAIETLQDITLRYSAEQKLREERAELEQIVERRTAELAADIEQREAAEKELLRRYAELTELNRALTETKEQLLQSEKLASIGQLAAGVAHEINNPIGYVHSNIGSLEKYILDLFSMLESYRRVEVSISDPKVQAALASQRQKLDLDFLLEDIRALILESKDGIKRVKKIVQDLKDFSHVDRNPSFQWADLHQGLESTLNIVANEIKYKADIVREYGVLPEVQCLQSQLNQVFMNLLVNAAHAVGEQRGTITIRSGASADSVWIAFSDTGSGIPESIRQKIFDPFFTTKTIGKGTGLGLSLAYGIIQKHNGSIELESEVGMGTTFRISLPIHHSHEEVQVADRGET
jgi:two-component system NtrC family sensor kinase